MDDVKPLFLMSCHKNGDEKLYLLASNDGINFYNLSERPFFSAPSIGLRDPSIIYYEGYYYVVYSHQNPPGYTGNDFGIARSPDLMNWEFIKNVSTDSVTNAYSAWAPEWFLDPSNGSLHVIVSISDDTNATHEIYELHPLTSSISGSWSSPTKLQVYNRNNMIDGCLVYDEGVYYLWFLDVSGGYIEYASSPTLTGPYTLQGSGDWAGFGTASPLYEAPCVIKISSSHWRVYFDKPTQKGVYYCDSFDNFATWSQKQLITTPDSFTVSHPTVCCLDNVVNLKDVTLTALSNINRNTSHKTRVFRSGSAQSIPAYSFTTVEFNDINYDKGAWSQSNFKFVAPVDGDYDIRSGVLFSNLLKDTRIIIRIYRNGSEIIVENQAHSAIDNNDLSVVAFDIFQLNKADTVEVKAYHESSSNKNLSHNSAHTFLMCRFIGF